VYWRACCRGVNFARGKCEGKGASGTYKSGEERHSDASSGAGRTEARARPRGLGFPGRTMRASGILGGGTGKGKMTQLTWREEGRK